MHRIETFKAGQIADQRGAVFVVMDVAVLAATNSVQSR